MTQVTLPSLGVLLAMVLIATVPVLHGVCVALRGGRHRPLRGGRPRPPAATGPAPFWVIVVAARGVKGLDAAVDAALALPRAFTAVLVADLADGRDVIDAVTRRANPRVGLVRPRGAGDDAARLLALLHDVAHGPEAPRRRHDDVVVGVIGPGDTVTAATLVDVAARFADARVAVVWPRRGASGASGSRRWLAALDAAAYVGAAGGRASDLSDLGRRPCFVRLSGLPGGGGRPGGPTRHTGGGAAVVRGDAGPRDGFDDRVRRVARRFGDLARATRTGDAAPADVATALAATVPALAAGAGLAATALGAALAV
ncbi:MAG: hypothetical protein KDC33_04325, partial [Thermoleophilia bacterium]|nr:hypothetical protein [Thermoleophilia bacterium]